MADTMVDMEVDEDITCEYRLAEDILLEADRLADLRNGEVIKRALGCLQNFPQFLQKCSCGFWENRAVFDELLDNYAKAKIRFTKLNRVEQRLVVSDRLVKIQLEAQRLKQMLSRIWPCPDCIKAFNPTNKHMFQGQHLQMRPLRWQYREPTPFYGRFCG